MIHALVRKALGVEVLLDVENSPQLRVARTARDAGRLAVEELIVHRKGATPAGEGVMGIIPGSMGTPGYVVRGKGVAASLNSASHGAGRRMSRTKAKELFTWEAAQALPARTERDRCCRPASTRCRWPTRTSTR